MKIFQILHNICHWETPFKSLDETFMKFPTDCLFVEAPDYVTEQWGFNEFAVGDDRFIPPAIPEDLIFDDEDGRFVEEEVLVRALAEAKEDKIRESENKLNEFIRTHSLTYTNGKNYAFTVDAQNMMRNAMTAYTIEAEMGDPTPIQYAAINEVAENWDYEDFKALYVAVFQYYKQWYAMHQEYATQINALETIREVNNFEIIYETDEERAAREQSEEPEENIPVEG